MTEFKIEKNVPIPARARLGRNAKYPWSKMEIGDSFFIPQVKHSKISGAVSNAAKKSGRKYSAHTVEGGVRIWRIA